MLRSQRVGKGSRWRRPHPRNWREVYGFLAILLLGFLALAYVLDWLKGVL
ncbi:MAG TPA: hypothetical protein VMX14_02080 [Anaerolineae bacterium]|nr:hypothetical protein [Anaerolineae bacterium]